MRSCRDVGGVRVPGGGDHRRRAAPAARRLSTDERLLDARPHGDARDRRPSQHRTASRRASSASSTSSARRSGEAAKNDWSNLDLLTATDEVKFVIQDRPDYEYAKDVVARHASSGRCAAVLFSPVHGVAPGQGARRVDSRRSPARCGCSCRRTSTSGARMPAGSDRGAPGRSGTTDRIATADNTDMTSGKWRASFCSAEGSTRTRPRR